MSLYDKENPRYLKECMESVFQQTVLPNEIVVVFDGPINEELQQVLYRYYNHHPELFKIVKLEHNLGLGIALAEGLKFCSYRLVARMDTDDIMVPERLEMQLNYFAQYPDTTILGSNINEFEGTIENVIGKRNVPETNTEIRAFSKKRNPFNHMTVMFDKNVIIEVGNYQPLPGFEDYYLWARLLKAGFKGHNLQQVLVYARTGKEMYSRRGGMHYLIPGIKGRYKVYQGGLGSLKDFSIVVGGHTIVSLLPNKLRGKFYQNKLRN